jgi:hypothetical protein
MRSRLVMLSGTMGTNTSSFLSVRRGVVRTIVETYSGLKCSLLHLTPFILVLGVRKLTIRVLQPTKAKGLRSNIRSVNSNTIAVDVATCHGSPVTMCLWLMRGGMLFNTIAIAANFVIYESYSSLVPRVTV